MDKPGKDSLETLGLFAIQSLDCLNDQIVQYIFTPRNADLTVEKELSPKEQETLKSSMVLIRRLLLDAQSKFRKMVDDNKQLAARIDGSIFAANQEVNALRAELADTNKRLSELGNGTTTTNGHSGGGNIVITSGNQAASEKEIMHKLKSNDEENELIQLREENNRLQSVIQNLTRDVDKTQSKTPGQLESVSCFGELKLELIQTRQELTRAKGALQSMKADRKRLKAEKLDLLNQMKQLYGALEDKEAELRDFIRNYEQRMRESDESIKQLASEKESCEREKWEIIKRARDAAERSVILRSQLDMKEEQIKSLEDDLSEARDVASNQSIKNSFTPESLPSPSSGNTATTPSEDLPPYETPPPSASYNTKGDNFSLPTSTPTEDKSTALPPFLSLLNYSANNSLGNQEDSLDSSGNESKRKKRRSFGSLSKVFSIGRTRRSIAVPTNIDLEEHDGSSLRVSLLSAHNYQEKLQVIDQSKNTPMSMWKANQVLAWLEIVLSMPIYGKMCAENVKSGKVLLELSDAELGSALGITNILHRRKLRLAIEEYRNPATVKCPKLSVVDHTWVSHRWLPDLGLRQYTTVFEVQLVDGRLLNIITRKDLEKYLGIHRKFHQASILNGVELLRRVGFDKELLAARRGQCEAEDKDPLVWTNQRVVKWIESIDLGEYAENLVDSGVNGALMTLEPSFNADVLATALGIPPSKSYVRRHLTSELETLLKPARAALETGSGEKRKVTGGTLGRSFSRSFRHGGEKGEEVSSSRFSLRGSIGRAFGRKIKEDLRNHSDIETPSKQKPIISGPISPPIKNSSFSSESLLADKSI